MKCVLLLLRVFQVNWTLFSVSVTDRFDVRLIMNGLSFRGLPKRYGGAHSQYHLKCKDMFCILKIYLAGFIVIN